LPPASDRTPPASGLPRKLFELSAVLPLPAYLLFGLARYAGALGGDRPEGEPAGPLWIAAELALLIVPLAYHAAYGLWFAKEGPATPAGPSERALSITERVSGVVLGVCLCLHFYWLEWPLLSGRIERSALREWIAAELSRTLYGLPLLAASELLLVLSAAFHTAYGLYSFGCRRVPAARNVRVFRGAGVFFGVLFALSGAALVIRFATGG
jgi:succinate dehydrogenase/fumarate reductase cytochrome b subunit